VRTLVARCSTKCTVHRAEEGRPALRLRKQQQLSSCACQASRTCCGERFGGILAAQFCPVQRNSRFTWRCPASTSRILDRAVASWSGCCSNETPNLRVGRGVVRKYEHRFAGFTAPTTPCCGRLAVYKCGGLCMFGQPACPATWSLIFWRSTRDAFCNRCRSSNPAMDPLPWRVCQIKIDACANKAVADGPTWPISHPHVKRVAALHRRTPCATAAVFLTNATPLADKFMRRHKMASLSERGSPASALALRELLDGLRSAANWIATLSRLES